MKDRNKEGQQDQAAETPPSASRGLYLVFELQDLHVVRLGLQC